MTPMEHIKNGEGLHVEFKTSFQKEVVETVVAFSNSKGGHIFVGVKDDGSVVGVTLGDESEQHFINTIKQSTEPSVIVDIERLQLEGKTVLDIIVDEYPVKPVATKGRYFKRRNNANHPMNATEISDAHMKTMNSSWDYFADPYHNLDD
ncbi:MAG: ATP-binding protein, partial [Campylobacterales bacterium]|nr:ATP-binding protein [Campylobacterales bacterium]